MCEIIRALIAGGKFPNYKLDNLENNSFSEINCPGNGDADQSQICAVNGGSAAQNYGWFILIEGKSIEAAEKPKWIMDENSIEILNLNRN